MIKVLIGLVVGLIIGAVGGFFVLGAGTGAGVAVGLSSGICSTVRAAQDLGLMTAEQVDEVLAQATRNFGGEVPEGQTLVGSAAECDAFLAKLKAAATE
jgi:hypothetical protein